MAILKGSGKMRTDWVHNSNFSGGFKRRLIRRSTCAALSNVDFRRNDGERERKKDRNLSIRLNLFHPIVVRIHPGNVFSDAEVVTVGEFYGRLGLLMPPYL